MTDPGGGSPRRRIRSLLHPLKYTYDATQNMSPVAYAIESTIGPRVRALSPDAVVLDVGTGRGHGRTADVRGRYVSLDIDPAVRPHVVGDATALPIADRSVDALCATSVMLLIPDPAAMFREAARVLRPGGQALIYTEMLSYVCLAGGTEVDIQRYTPARLRQLTRCFDEVELVPVGSHHTFYANILWRYRQRWRLGPLRPLLGVVFWLWSRTGGADPECPVGHLVIGLRTGPTPLPPAAHVRA